MKNFKKLLSNALRKDATELIFREGSPAIILCDQAPPEPISADEVLTGDWILRILTKLFDEDNAVRARQRKIAQGFFQISGTGDVYVISRYSKSDGGFQASFFFSDKGEQLYRDRLKKWQKHERQSQKVPAESSSTTKEEAPLSEESQRAQQNMSSWVSSGTEDFSSDHLSSSSLESEALLSERSDGSYDDPQSESFSSRGSELLPSSSGDVMAGSVVSEGLGSSWPSEGTNSDRVLSEAPEALQTFFDQDDPEDFEHTLDEEIEEEEREEEPEVLSHSAEKVAPPPVPPTPAPPPSPPPSPRSSTPPLPPIPSSSASTQVSSASSLLPSPPPAVPVLPLPPLVPGSSPVQTMVSGVADFIQASGQASGDVPPTRGNGDSDVYAQRNKNLIKQSADQVKALGFEDSIASNPDKPNEDISQSFSQDLKRENSLRSFLEENVNQSSAPSVPPSTPLPPKSKFGDDDFSSSVVSQLGDDKGDDEDLPPVSEASVYEQSSGSSLPSSSSTLLSEESSLAPRRSLLKKMGDIFSAKKGSSVAEITLDDQDGGADLGDQNDSLDFLDTSPGGESLSEQRSEALELTGSDELASALEGDCLGDDDLELRGAQVEDILKRDESSASESVHHLSSYKGDVDEFKANDADVSQALSDELKAPLARSDLGEDSGNFSDLEAMSSAGVSMPSDLRGAAGGFESPEHTVVSDSEPSEVTSRFSEKSHASPSHKPSILSDDHSDSHLHMLSQSLDQLSDLGASWGFLMSCGELLWLSQEGELKKVTDTEPWHNPAAWYELGELASSQGGGSHDHQRPRPGTSGTFIVRAAKSRAWFSVHYAPMMGGGLAVSMRNLDVATYSLKHWEIAPEQLSELNNLKKDLIASDSGLYVIGSLNRSFRGDLIAHLVHHLINKSKFQVVKSLQGPGGTMVGDPRWGHTIKVDRGLDSWQSAFEAVLSPRAMPTSVLCVSGVPVEHSAKLLREWILPGAHSGIKVLWGICDFSAHTLSERIFNDLHDDQLSPIYTMPSLASAWKWLVCGQRAGTKMDLELGPMNPENILRWRPKSSPDVARFHVAPSSAKEGGATQVWSKGA